MLVRVRFSPASIKMKPKYRKNAKAHKGRLNYAIKYDDLKFGMVGIKAEETARVTGEHLSTIVLTIKKILKKEGIPLLRVFPHIPVTEKPSEVRMGKGKGSVSHYITRIQTGSIIIEIKGGIQTKSLIALKIAQTKLPLQTTIVSSKS